ncbi:MAG: hypothetical protein M3Y12_14880 [Bacteroidota bacterium]|nr:hypothetical protein [Bacteroidota bacterium]
MKHFSSQIILVIVSLWVTAAQAQNYRPFRFGLSYQLNERATPGDTTHLLRLATRQAQGTDSVFGFNARTSRRPSVLSPESCGYYTSRPDNLFGATLRLRPGGEYVLATANGATFSLRPRAPLGQVWPATTTGLTGHVTSRTLGTVLGQADSLATMVLSDGAVLVLSRRFGWVSGPALGHYLSGRLPQATLTLTALPELGLGLIQLDAFVVHDFQPGDVFLRRGTSTSYVGIPASCVSTIWTRDSILSRSLSANGDTIRYQQRRRTLTRGCYGPPTLGAATVQTLRITRNTSGLNQPTNAWLPVGTSAFSASIVNLPAARTANYQRRPVQLSILMLRCGTSTTDSLSLVDTSSLDYGFHIWTAAGLGNIRTEFLGFTTDIDELIGYRKGTETWGQLTPFAQLLAARDVRPATTTAAFPNPFAAELNVAFELGRPQAVGLTLRDALGRIVREQAATTRPGGAQRMALATAGLPGGVYTLHLHFAGEGRTEVLRVLKAE